MKPVSGGQLTKHKRQLRDNSEDNLRRDQETVQGPGQTKQSLSLSAHNRDQDNLWVTPVCFTLNSRVILFIETLFYELPELLELCFTSFLVRELLISD